MGLLKIIGGMIILIELIYFLCWTGFKSVYLLLGITEKTTSLLAKVFPSAKILGIFAKKLKRILNTVSTNSGDTNRYKRHNSWEAGKVLNFIHYRKKMKKLSSHHSLII